MTVSVITVGLHSYINEPTWKIQPAADSRVEVELLLRQHGATPEDWTSKANTTTLVSTLGNWTRQIEHSHVIYWVGHGEYSSDGYLAALADSFDPLDEFNALTTNHLLVALRNQARNRRRDGFEDNWVLLILDTCGSGDAVDDLSKSLGKKFRNVGVIAAASEGAAYIGRLPAELEHVLEGFNGNDSAGIPLSDLLNRLASRIGSVRVHNEFDSSAVLPLRRDALPPMQATLDRYHELHMLLENAPKDVRNHFYTKAQGTEIGELAWHFTGRGNERRQVSTWLRDAQHGMFVVSGVAGSGKSALLGMLLATSDDTVLSALAKIGYEPIPDNLRPVGVSFDSVIHAGSHTVADTVTALSMALSLDTGADLDALLQAIRSRPNRRHTILIDALDESRDALTIAASLRRLAALPHVRVIVGTRQSMHEDPDHPLPRDSVILDTLDAPPECTVRLQQDPDAVRRYVDTRLRSALPLTHEQAAVLSATIAQYEQPFLFAHLAVREIIAESELATNQELLEQMLGSGHSGIFGHAVARLARNAPETEVLLHSLTYARGNGFPRTGGVWAIAASALTDTPINDTHVEHTIKVAAPFIMQDSEFGQSVYRLAHRTFAEWYRRNDAQ
jgi:hypothetical protein